MQLTVAIRCASCGGTFIAKGKPSSCGGRSVRNGSVAWILGIALLAATAGDPVFDGVRSTVFVRSTHEASSAAADSWIETFESYAVGPLSEPWVDESLQPNYAGISIDVAHGGSKSLHLADFSMDLGTTAARALARVNFTDLTLWAYALQRSGIFTPVLSSPQTWAAFRAGMGPSGTFIYNLCGPSWLDTGVPYVVRVWYELRFVVRRSTNLYDMWVNDTLVVSDAPLCDTEDSFNVLRLVSAGSWSGEFYVDDLRAVLKESASDGGSTVPTGFGLDANALAFILISVVGGAGVGAFLYLVGYAPRRRP